MEKEFNFDRFSLPKTKQQLNVVPTPGGSVMKEGMMMSPNFVKGKSGWRLDAEGNFEGNDGTFRGNLQIGGVSRTIDTFDDIQTAIDGINDDGGGTLYLKSGTYNVGASGLTLYSSVSIVGISASQTIINFGSTAGNLTCAGGTAYTTGTITSITGGVNVTGSGTSWLANVTAGQHIFLNTRWYKIAAVLTDTTLTLAEGFGDSNVTFPSTYRISSIKVDVNLKNFSVTGSSGTGIVFSDARNLTIDNVKSYLNNKGITITNCSEFSIERTFAISNTSSGVEITNMGVCDFESFNSIGNGGNGFLLDNVDSISMQSFVGSGNTLDGFNGTSIKNCDFHAFSVSLNGGNGLELVATSEQNTFSGFNCESNTSDGVKLTATTDNTHFINGDFIGNGGYGINIAASTCDNNIIATNAFLTNSSGSISNSGTGTIIIGNSPSSVDTNRLDSGTYTPTLTNVANLDASTAYECQYLRVGNTVTVSGKVDVDPTAGATLTQLGISLPIASNIGTEQDCCGTANAAAVASMSGAILGDSANDRAEMRFTSVDTTNKGMYFTFTYQVI